MSLVQNRLWYWKKGMLYIKLQSGSWINIPYLSNPHTLTVQEINNLMSKKITKKEIELATVTNWVSNDRESHTDKLVHGKEKKKDK